MRRMWLGRANEEIVARTSKWGECGSDEQMRRMWLGRANEENVAWKRDCCGWPSSLIQLKYWVIIKLATINLTEKFGIIRFDSSVLFWAQRWTMVDEEQRVCGNIVDILLRSELVPVNSSFWNIQTTSNKTGIVKVKKRIESLAKTQIF